MASIAAIRPVVVNVTARTNWIFVLVDADDGLTGIGEATLDGHEPQVLAEIAAASRRMIGQVAAPLAAYSRPRPGAFGGLAHAAAASAIEQALWDLLGQRLGAPVVDLLGGSATSSVRAYANVNRGILGDRSADGFAAAARAAVADGFDAVKVAPFDGLRWEAVEDRRARGLIDAGLERLHAVRAAIGDEVELLIDCHGRFNGRSAAVIVPEIAAVAPSWIEDPVPQRDLDGWRRVRAATDGRLAGGEMLLGAASFRRFIEATGVDVVLADVKYCGGIAGLQAAAAVADSFGIVLSPHNPSGPVGTAATVAVAAANPALIPITEFAWGEAGWRSELVGGAEVVERGAIRVPRSPGLGIRLNEALAAAHPYRDTPIGTDLWER